MERGGDRALVAAAAGGALAAGAALFAAWSYRAEAARCRGLREEEHAGRVRAEVRVRELAHERIAANGYRLKIIGIVHSPYPTRWGTPRQPGLCPSSQSEIRLAAQIPPTALTGLDGYSHAWILWGFHENTNVNAAGGADGGDAEGGPGKQDTLFRGLRPLIRAPGLGGKKTGIFACRTPHRPNAVGLSLVAIDSVDLGKRRVVVRGADVVDGTPVFDIKPFHPVCDTPAAASAVGMELSGWGLGGERVAGWSDWADVARAIAPGAPPAFNLAVTWTGHGGAGSFPAGAARGMWACRGADAGGEGGCFASREGVACSTCRAPAWVWRSAEKRVPVLVKAAALAELASCTPRKSLPRTLASLCEALALDVRGVREGRFGGDSKTYELRVAGVVATWTVASRGAFGPPPAIGVVVTRVAPSAG